MAFCLVDSVWVHLSPVWELPKNLLLIVVIAEALEALKALNGAGLTCGGAKALCKHQVLLMWFVKKISVTEAL